MELNGCAYGSKRRPRSMQPKQQRAIAIPKQDALFAGGAKDKIAGR